MDATTLSSEGRRELDELRSRAYGPEADIHSDADALARLIELEHIARTDATMSATDLDAPIRGVAGAVRGARAHQPAVLVEDPSTDGQGDDAAQLRADTVRRPWWRRVPVASFVAVAAVLGLGLGLTLPALASPQPATTLRMAPIDGSELDFDMYGIRSDSPVRYEPFHDLEVWSAQTEQGTTCIVVTTATSEWMAAGCAPEPLDPVAEVSFYPGMRDIDGLDLPVGSVVRFVLDGDVMRVWIAESSQGA